MAGQLDVIVGGQYGSEGKGHFVAQLARRRLNNSKRLHVVRVAGPNAGHTAYGVLDGKPWALRQIPAAAVVDLDIRLYIAAGSEIDERVLQDEIDRLNAAGYEIDRRLYIDGQATMLDGHHIEAETGMPARMGSTGKGIGAARADRIQRNANLWSNDPSVASYDTGKLLRYALRRDESVIIEGTQGYGLGLHAGHYPYCTSSDCRAIDFLAMTGISPWCEDVQLEVWVIARTFPIRVAGNSGPLKNELEWEDLTRRTGGHIQPERTTVTQKIRRVGEWDEDLVRDALRANGAPAGQTHLIITFLDYIDPIIAGAIEPKQLSQRAIDWIMDNCPQQPVAVTTGPDSIVWSA